MAVRTDASGDYLRRTTSLPAYNAFTLCGWSRVQVDTGAQFQVLGAINATSSAVAHLCWDQSSDVMSLRYFTGSGANTAFGSRPAVGEAFFWCFQGDGANYRGHFRKADENALTSVSLAISDPGTLTSLNVHSNESSQYVDGDVWNVMCFDRALSADELLAQSYFERVLFRSSLNFHWRLKHTGDTVDRSGNGRDATVGGTLADAGEYALWRPATLFPNKSLNEITLYGPQTQAPQASPSAVAVTLTAGRGLLVNVVWSDASVISGVTVSGAGNGAMQLNAATAIRGGDIKSRWFYLPTITTGGAQTVTPTFSSGSGSSNLNCHSWEVTGHDTTDMLGVHAWNEVDSGALSYTREVAGSLLLMAQHGGNNDEPAIANWTTNAISGFAYRSQAYSLNPAGASNSVNSANGYGVHDLIEIRPASAGGPATPLLSQVLC